MEHILDIIMIPIQVIIVFYSLYYFILACFGLMKRRERITVAPKNTFAAVICAHNEEKVVWQLIDNLKQLHYPKDMYDIYVVADNCTGLDRRHPGHHLRRSRRYPPGPVQPQHRRHPRLFPGDADS